MAKFQTDYIKLDMDLVRGIETSLPRRMIVEGVVRIAQSLGIAIIAEGIETIAEYGVLRAMGVRYIQGYLLARPGLRHLPAFFLPEERCSAVA
ncbi:EAL domain-containing protein (putative c-di-GMP-specific phosphodiesterase class I) [Sphingomonas japonica]|uniref:EAL domain-containing protein (Putative c-di-GMP-specific phosphodiesterase class I) n=1 Tax=Sphingomonas japonica TaxID=511662 RepID=A0ABX0U699_9SPHN|nr:EAL domain-containing protein (putative c-di-GMP-specific phosphodiesterase class I) [Sphingomonas japonica]